MNPLVRVIGSSLTGVGRRIPFIFLDDIKQRFTSKYNDDQVDQAIAYGLNEFSSVIQERMDYFVHDPDADAFRRARGELAQVKDIMVQNIERVLERGERIDILVDRTEDLNHAAFAFRKRSTALKRAMWWKNAKLMLLLGFVAIMAVYFTISGACGFPTWQDCRS
jgi:vesicle-associated membrane protein 7